MSAATEIEHRIAAHLADSVACHSLYTDDGRIGCRTPLLYPDGDNVVVWVRPRVGGTFEVSDYGEALAESISGVSKERDALERFAAFAATGQGARFVRGRLFAESDWDELPECVWRVGIAASQLAQAAASYRPRRERETAREDEFTSAVAHELQSLPVTVERDHPLRGVSSHRHKATFYLPQTETVLEPVAGHWNQVASVFARLYDLRGANGYKLFSLLDDRAGAPREDVPSMLVDVSRVVEWSRRDEWLSDLT